MSDEHPSAPIIDTQRVAQALFHLMLLTDAEQEAHNDVIDIIAHTIILVSQAWGRHPEALAPYLARLEASHRAAGVDLPEEKTDGLLTDIVLGLSRGWDREAL